MKRATIYLILSMVLRAVQEIAKWRPSLTWLPSWVYGTGGLFNLDGYHIATTLHWLLAIAVGIEIGLAIHRRLKLWEWLFLLVVAGQTFDVFYHMVFMRRPEFWLMDYINSLIQLLKWIF